MALEFSADTDTRQGRMNEDSATGLFSRLIGDAGALFRNEVALAKAELATAASNAKLGAAALAIAAVVMLAGAMSLIAALILGLAEVVAPWLAALIVGVVLAVIGLAMFQTAKKKFSATAMPFARTQTSLQQDAAVLVRRT
jgi:xanthine/uracil permease